MTCTSSTDRPDDLAVHRISAGYGDRLALTEVSARLPGGRITSLVGANGAGKSSLLAVLAGVLRPTAGEVTGLGPRRPALVAQRSAVSDALPLTVRETVAMGRWADLGPWRRARRADRELVEECMERLGVAPLAGRQLGSLSGGQRQRALVAQGLAQRPEVLLLDEPTAGLDAEARERIAAALAEAGAAGTTVVHATHDLHLALDADHCLLLADGRPLAEGRPAEVLTPEALRRAWGTPELPAARAAERA
ncbi:zinc/manganese transport system ATP-binding protein [Streptomyces zhaozhouensis]|uniref:Zinc/manganese transport system ATP-binding protein n=1 Tax=Streptomyces zhaozhouensis TaxID=1300267 RepID=A0A286DU88_9ACTN|nr:zinc ABC transporter ATP-binding protein AztA [Streptomyces zhaozhouensis]SOD62221.1 zinc/manganese transport system ATP-binding protein [Streptomyces zhaozhouensis]